MFVIPKSSAMNISNVVHRFLELAKYDSSAVTVYITTDEDFVANSLRKYMHSLISQFTVTSSSTQETVCCNSETTVVHDVPSFFIRCSYCQRNLQSAREKNRRANAHRYIYLMCIGAPILFVGRL